MPFTATGPSNRHEPFHDGHGSSELGRLCTVHGNGADGYHGGTGAMTENKQSLELECQVRLIEYAAKQSPADTPLDLWIDGFWAGVKAQHNRRPVAWLQERLTALRARYGIADPETVIEGFGR